MGLWFYRNEGGAGVLERLTAALAARGHEVVPDLDLPNCYVLDGRVHDHRGDDVSDLDLVYVMNADEQTPHQRDVMRALELCGVEVVNAFAAFERAQDKFVANTLLRAAGIPVPDAALVPPGVPRRLAEDLFGRWGQVVVKLRRGHGGRGVQRFDDVDRFLDFVDATAGMHDSYYLEAFVPFGDKDMRVDLIDGELVGGYRRQRSHFFKTNVHHGARMVPEVPPDAAVELARRAAAALGIACTIVDVVAREPHGGHDDGRGVGPDDLVVLEVNPMLGVFTEAGLRTGVNTVQRAEDIHPVYAYDDRKIAMLAAYLDRCCRRSRGSRADVAGLPGTSEERVSA